MRPARVIKLGEEFLKDVSVEDLKSMQAREKDQGQDHAADGRAQEERTVPRGDIQGNRKGDKHYGWLSRLENGMEGRYDCKSPGRPAACLMSR